MIIWDQPADQPLVYLNDDVRRKVLKLTFKAARPVTKGQAVTAGDINGLKKAVLRHGIHDKPFVLVIQGKGEKLFLVSGRMNGILGNRDFELLAEALATEGLSLTSEDSTFNVFLDVIRNSYDGFPPAHKRRETIQQAELEIERVKKDAVGRVKRHLKLPTLICHMEDEFLPLLLETRQTYIDGYYFSCIASGVTTADRICNRLVQRYGIPAEKRESIFRETFGQKIPRLRSLGVINDQTADLLERMNRIRTKHLHPKDRLQPITITRDALRVIRLLHEVLEETFSVYRDYMIGDGGQLVPRPLV